MDSLPAKRRTKIEQRGKEILDQYMTLQELRKTRQLTQEELAEILKIKQENISRIEKRSDILISTLRNHIEAMGGQLEVSVKFPESNPIQITGLGSDNLNTSKPANRGIRK
jgi:transcriptional regulator with XRE-family HTH domain